MNDSFNFEDTLWDLMENVNKLKIEETIKCNCGSINIIKDDNLFTCKIFMKYQFLFSIVLF